MFNRLYLSPGKVGAIAACNYWSCLRSVHQVPITAGWTEAVWNKKFARHFYTWPTLGIESQTFWSWVQRPVHLATCSHYHNPNIRRMLGLNKYIRYWMSFSYDLHSSRKNSWLSSCLCQSQYSICCSSKYPLLQGGPGDHGLKHLPDTVIYTCAKVN